MFQVPYLIVSVARGFSIAQIVSTFAHVEELKKFSAAFLGPLPKLEKSKFEPPRIKRIQEYLQ